VGVAHILKFHYALDLLCNGTAEDILLHGGEAVEKDGDQFHHEICHVPECCAVEGFVNQVDHNTLMLCIFYVNCLHNLSLGLGRREGCGGKAAGRGNGGLGGFIAIPYILELEAKGNGWASWVEMT